jgi:hypothetical protein
MSETIIKYVLAASVVANATLLSLIFGWLEFFAFVFVVIIFICLWYIRKLLKTIDQINSDIASMYNIFDAFADSLESLYGMEMFYGEPVVEDLIKRSHFVLNNLIQFQEKYSLDLIDVAELEIIDQEENYATEDQEEN